MSEQKSPIQEGVANLKSIVKAINKLEGVTRESTQALDSVTKIVPNLSKALDSIKIKETPDTSKVLVALNGDKDQGTTGLKHVVNSINKMPVATDVSTNVDAIKTNMSKIAEINGQAVADLELEGAQKKIVNKESKDGTIVELIKAVSKIKYDGTDVDNAIGATQETIRKIAAINFHDLGNKDFKSVTDKIIGTKSEVIKDGEVKYVPDKNGLVNLIKAMSTIKFTKEEFDQAESSIIHAGIILEDISKYISGTDITGIPIKEMSTIILGTAAVVNIDGNGNKTTVVPKQAGLLDILKAFKSIKDVDANITEQWWALIKAFNLLRYLKIGDFADFNISDLSTKLLGKAAVKEGDTIKEPKEAGLLDILKAFAKVPEPQGDMQKNMVTLIAGLNELTNIDANALNKIVDIDRATFSILLDTDGNKGLISLIKEMAKIDTINPNLPKYTKTLANSLNSILTNLDWSMFAKVDGKLVGKVKALNEAGLVQLFNSFGKLELDFDDDIGEQLSNAIYLLQKAIAGVKIDESTIKGARSVQALVETVKIITELSIGMGIVFTMFKLRLAIEALKDVIGEFSTIEKPQESASEALDVLKKSTDSINKLSVGKATVIKLMMLQKSVAMVKSIIKGLTPLAEGAKATKYEEIEFLSSLKFNVGMANVIGFKQLKNVVDELPAILQKMNSIPKVDDKHIMHNIKQLTEAITAITAIGGSRNYIKARTGIHLLKSIIGELGMVIESIGNIKANPAQVRKTNRALKPIAEIVASLKSILTTLILMAPVAMLFLMISPVLIVVYWLFGKVMSIILRTFSMMAQLADKKSIITVMGLILMIVLVTVTMLLLAYVGTTLIPAMPLILMTLGCIVGFLAILVGLLWLLSLIAPVIAAASPALLVLAGFVLLIVLVLTAMWMLSNIELDGDMIQHNISVIFNTMGYMVDNFKASWVVELLGVAVAMVFMTVAVMGILLIAVMLRLVQELNLDRGKIMDNVNTVVNICFEILGIFRQKTRESGDGSTLQEVLNYLGIGGLGTVITALAAMLTFVAMTIAVVAILIIASMLRLLGEFGKENILKGRDIALLAVEISNEIMNIIISGGSYEIASKDKEAKDIREVVPAPALLETILGLGKMLLYMVTIGALFLLVGMLKLLGEFNLDISAIRNNVLKLFKDLDQIVAAIINPNTADPEQPKQTSFLDSVVGFVKGVFDGAALLVNLGKLGLVLGALAMIKVIIGYLNEIAGYTYVDVTTKVRNIITQATNVANEVIKIEVGDTDDLEDATERFNFLNNTLLGLVSTIKLLNNIGNATINKDGLNKNFEIIRNLEFPDVDVNKAKSIFMVTELVKRAMDNLGSAKPLDDMASAMEKVSKADANRTGQITSHYIKFLDKVNSVDMSKLQTTTNMMKYWAELSKSLNGNFEGLAESLNVKIMPMLKELNDTMEQITNTLKQANEQRAEMYVDKAQPGAGDPNKIAAVPMAPTGMQQPTAAPTIDPLKQKVLQTQQRMRQAQLNATSVADILLSGEGSIKIKH